jgi:hypothetical protein
MCTEPLMKGAQQSFGPNRRGNYHNQCYGILDLSTKPCDLDLLENNWRCLEMIYVYVSMVFQWYACTCVGGRVSIHVFYIPMVIPTILTTFFGGDYGDLRFKCIKDKNDAKGIVLGTPKHTSTLLFVNDNIQETNGNTKQHCSGTLQHTMNNK